MGVVSTSTWDLIHDWDTDKYESWKEKDLLEEIKAVQEYLKNVLRKSLLLSNVLSFLEKNDYEIVLKKKYETKIIDFSNLLRLLRDWEFFRITCNHYCRIWLAQDESYLGCSYTDKTCPYDSQNRCPKYEPMAKLRSIEEILEWRIA